LDGGNCKFLIYDCDVIDVLTNNGTFMKGKRANDYRNMKRKKEAGVKELW